MPLSDREKAAYYSGIMQGAQLDAAHGALDIAKLLDLAVNEHHLDLRGMAEVEREIEAWQTTAPRPWPKKFTS